MLASAGDHPVAQQTAIIEEKLLPIISAIREEPAKFLNRRITSSLPQKRLDPSANPAAYEGTPQSNHG